MARGPGDPETMPGQGTSDDVPPERNMTAEVAWLVKRLSIEDPDVKDLNAYEAGLRRALEATQILVERLAALGRAPGGDLWDRARHVADDLRRLADELDVSADELLEQRGPATPGWRALSDLAGHIRLTADGVDDILVAQGEGPRAPIRSADATTALADWIVAYTLGGAHSGTEPEGMVQSLVRMAGIDELVLDLARVRLSRVESLDEDLRRRTVHLLATAARRARVHRLERDQRDE